MGSNPTLSAIKSPIPPRVRFGLRKSRLLRANFAELQIGDLSGEDSGSPKCATPAAQRTIAAWTTSVPTPLLGVSRKTAISSTAKGVPHSSIVPGDVITSINNEPIKSLDDMLTVLEKHQPGETVTLNVWRSGKSRKQALALAAGE